MLANLSKVLRIVSFGTKSPKEVRLDGDGAFTKLKRITGENNLQLGTRSIPVLKQKQEVSWMLNSYLCHCEVHIQ